MPTGPSHTSPTSPYELEELIYSMECQPPSASPPATGEGEDLYTALAEKENNLLLAAELGKALLGRNELLVEENERLAEQYSRKLEELEQDKHKLRLKLTATEGEYELRVHEVTTDLQMARGELADYKESSRSAEKRRTEVVEALQEQNQRLAGRLKESSRQEEALNVQLKQLREKMNLRQSSMTDHISTLDTLRDEILMLTDKKLELERRMKDLVEETEGMSVTLDGKADKILALERENEEKEVELRHKERDIEDLRHNNLNLSDRLEAVSRGSSSPSVGHTSLMNEMDMSENEISRHSHQDLLGMDQDVECDDPVLSPLCDGGNLRDLRNEVLEVVSQLRVLSEQIRQPTAGVTGGDHSTGSSGDFSISLEPGLLSGAVQELRGLVRTRLLRGAQGGCSGCGAKAGDGKMSLEQQCHKALEAVDKMNLELTDTKDKLKHKSEEATRLAGELTLAEKHRDAVSEERDNLRGDLENSHLAKDEIVKKAWDSRDQAVARKNACEIELARTRIDLMSVNSQLLEAITQKVELSQQLDQWQQDMQQLLDEQMRLKLKKMAVAAAPASDSDSSTGRTEKRTTSRRLFNLLNMLRK